MVAASPAQPVARLTKRTKAEGEAKRGEWSAQSSPADTAIASPYAPAINVRCSERTPNRLPSIP
jgi:hypothetical protein